jgi:MOSC domain-containing protein YiiM
MAQAAGPTFPFMTGSVQQISVSSGGVPKRAIAAGKVTPQGIEGDGHAHPAIHGGPLRAVLLITAEGIEELAALGFPMAPGSLGENITTRGIPRHEWRVGQRWRIGTEVVVEITKRRGPCKALNVYGPKIHTAIFDALAQAGDPASPRWGLSGFYASVVVPGIIRPGDPIVSCD